MTHSPLISAVVCTRNRGASVVATIETILANTHPDFEVLLIDQSTDDNTWQAIAPFQVDARFRYLRSRTRGLGRARNLGLRHARGAVVAFTDDDCTVPENWLSVMAAVFAAHPRVTVAFCNVVAAPHNHRDGYIPMYQRTDNKLVRSFREKSLARGIGAGIAVRRRATLAIGGFDEALGAGGRFPSGEDWDLALRALAHGQWIYETHEVAVLHDGFRTWRELRDLTRRDWIGIGATYAKPLRRGHWQAVFPACYEAFVIGLLAPLAALLRFQAPRGLRRFLYFWLGFWQGWRVALDVETLRFRDAADNETVTVPADDPALLPEPQGYLRLARK